MRRDSRVRLAEVLGATQAIERFISGADDQAFEADYELQSAVMYQLMVIGEALNRLSREQPDVASQIPALSETIGMRNHLIHGYDTVDQALVWRTARDDVPRLSKAVEKLLAAADE